MVWLRKVRPGRIANQLRRFTAPGLPKVWRPEDFVTAFDAINRRQGRYSPGANLDSWSTSDRAAADAAERGAVRSPAGLLKWYLSQLDETNDHPRFDLDVENDRIAASVAARQARDSAETAATTRLDEATSRGNWWAAREALTQLVHGGRNATTPRA